jgi:dihydropteroate synthase
MSKRPEMPTAQQCVEMGRTCACYNLRRAARAVTQLFDVYFDPIGLRATQYTVLAVLAHAPDHPPTVTELASGYPLWQKAQAAMADVFEGELLCGPRKHGQKRLPSQGCAARIALSAASCYGFSAGLALADRSPRRLRPEGFVSGRRERFQEVVRGAVARRGAALMGICNVTPDSFSDGGRYLDRAAACARVDELVREGADIVDIGGESTRPGSSPVPASEQIHRVVDVVRYAAERTCVSIDTMDPEVAAACLDAGAHAINDVSLLSHDELARVAGGSGAALILSHARAPQTTMKGYGFWPLDGYGDVVKDVIRDWQYAANRAVELGVARDALVMDPGLGFSKTSRHSFELLRRAGQLVEGIDAPVLFGASRKSFLTLIDRDATPEERVGASIAAALHAVRAGVSILRVHDVRATRQAMDMEIVLGTPRRKV